MITLGFQTGIGAFGDVQVAAAADDLLQHAPAFNADRTAAIDRIIQKSSDQVEQFVILGAGFDTRCYGSLKRSGLQFFELDQAATQRLKRVCLQKAGIDAAHVHFVEVDFVGDHWTEELRKAGYDPGKASLFLLEGVTTYLSEETAKRPGTVSFTATRWGKLINPKSKITGATPTVRETAHFYFPLGAFQAELEEHMRQADAIAALAIAIAATVVSFVMWRRVSEEAAGGQEHLLEGGQGRTRFFAIWGVWAGVWFALQIVFATIAAFWVPPCGS